MKLGGRARMKICLFLDVLVTLTEVAGTLVLGSLLLGENFLKGVYDFLLFSMNIHGHIQERNGDSRWAKAIANISDLLLALGFFTIAGFGFTRLTAFYPTENLNGAWIFAIEFSAIAVNLICTNFLKPVDTINGASARLKLRSGAWLSFSTMVSGVLIYFFHCAWLDPVASITAGIGGGSVIMFNLYQKDILQKYCQFLKDITIAIWIFRHGL
ncbi:hypothetical protein D4R52_00460 [bacterium]|nr:MAG: hypothetical protein D4R52_00460 [bacterium]